MLPKNLLILAFGLSLASHLSWAESRNERSLRIVQYNVGNADLSLDFSADSVRLHGEGNIRGVRNKLALIQPDLILLQEILHDRPQLLDPENPVLPSGYTGRCPISGQQGSGMVCVGWKESSLALEQERDCRGKFYALKQVAFEGKILELVEEVTSRDLQESQGKPGAVLGGFVHCKLTHKATGEKIDAYSVYSPHPGLKLPRIMPWVGDGHIGVMYNSNPPTIGATPNSARFAIHNALWDAGTLQGTKAVIGGDFNDSKCTWNNYGKCDIPYPERFGTLLGYFKPGYGRWNSRAETKPFFGSLEKGGAARKGLITEIVQARIIKPRVKLSKYQYDHLLANFGEPQPFSFGQVTCNASACVEGDPDFKDLAEPNRCVSCDHRPLVSELSW